jgi:hypothetical protein
MSVHYSHFVDIDGYGDTCLFRVYNGAPETPVAVLRLIDLPETARFLWPLIVDAVTA